MNEDAFKRLIAAFRDAYGEGREDFSDAYKDAREAKGKGREGTRISHMLGTNPTLIRLREMLGIANPEDVERRQRMGLGLKSGRADRTGQILGTLAADLTQDTTRNIYWLLNAAQATGNVITEEVVNRVNPDLYASEYVRDPGGNRIKTVRRDKYGEPVQNQNFRNAVNEKLVDPEYGMRMKDVGVKDGYYQRRKYRPGDVASLGIATGAAINAGMGLLSPMGGMGGYEAVIKSEDDPTRTANVLAEVGAKYILGRTGGLLPYNEFKKHRPDVSKGEYNAYKAFKYDKGTDLNPFDDGKVGLPTGVLKATTDGIHGPEVQFLGRSLPLTTTGIPFLTSLVGTGIGASRRRPIRGGLIGGFTGLATGGAAGLLLERERQRRNGLSNFPQTQALDPEEAQVGF